MDHVSDAPAIRERFSVAVRAFSRPFPTGLTLALCATLCSAACERRGDRTRCMEQWRQLVEQQEPAQEQRRAQAFAECARKNKLVYALALTDRTSGSELPIAQLGAHGGPISVRITVELNGKQEVLRWEPKSAESVYPLLME